MAEVAGGVRAFSGRFSGARGSEAENAAEDMANLSLGPLARIERHPQWPILSHLPLKLIVSVPITPFKVRDLLALEKGQMIRSSWKTSEDAPVTVADVDLALCEFEVVDQRLAIRLTRLTTL